MTGGVPLRVPAGLALTGMSWALYWTLTSLWTQPCFVGLWLGYIITVDGLVRWRTGTSMIDRGRGRFLFAFACSVPFWWAFEWCNRALRCWSYVPPVRENEALRILLFSVSFATVLPALLETIELLRWVFRPRGARREQPPDERPGGPPIGQPPSGVLAGAVVALGVLLLILMLAFPRELFPLVWVFPLLIFDSLNRRAGWPSLWQDVAARRWRTPLAVAAAGLICGFFWEFWNFGTGGVHWVYHLPAIVSHAHVFQMPLLGYLGYLPFAASSYAFYQTAQHLLNRARTGAAGGAGGGEAGPPRGPLRRRNAMLPTGKLLCPGPRAVT